MRSFLFARDLIFRTSTPTQLRSSTLLKTRRGPHQSLGTGRCRHLQIVRLKTKEAVASTSHRLTNC
jgi:hypothetical protein